MSRPRVLLVSPVRPLPATVGGRQRTDLIWRALARFTDVDLFVTESAAQVPPDEQRALREQRRLVGLQALRRRGQWWPWRGVRWIHPPLVDRLAHNLGATSVWFAPDPAVAPLVRRLAREREYDLAVGRYARIAMRAGLSELPRTILDADDLDTAVYEARLRETGVPRAERLILQKHLRGVERALARALPLFTATWVTDDQDAGAVRSDIVHTLPNIPWQRTDDAPPDPLPPSPPSCKRITVIGSWDHTPNVRGLERFLESSWPAIRAGERDATLAVYGSRLSDAKRRAWSLIPGVEVIGFVHDVLDAYRDAAFAVSPVLQGGGTKIKVLESLRYGRTLVVTVHSHRGYEGTLRDGESLLVAQDPADFAKKCLRLLREPDQRRALATHGHECVQKHYSFASLCRTVERTVEEVLSAPRGAAR